MKFFQKKSKAVKRWHSRAMLIDLRKTKVTIIHAGEPDDYDWNSKDYTKFPEDIEE